MAKGYIIAELEITNPTEFEPYRQKVLATVEAYSGRFLVRSRDVELLEGDEPAKIAVVIEFDSPERAREWYNSSQYQEILPIRLRNSTGRVLLTGGVPPV